MTVYLTKHISIRCRQRGIPEEDILLIIEHGTETRSGYMMTKREIAAFMQSANKTDPGMKQLRNRFSKLQDVLVIMDGQTAITAYRATREQRRRQTRRW